MDAVVEFHTLGGRETVVLEGDRCTAGRAPDNTIRIAGDPTLSAVHAVFERLGGVWCVRDLASSNGTFVNGQRVVGGRPLHDGDELRLGATRLAFRSNEPRPVTETTEAGPPPELDVGDRRLLVALCRPKLEGSTLDPPAPLTDVAERCGLSEEAAEAALDRVARELGMETGTPARLAQEAIQRGLVSAGDLHGAEPPSFVRAGDTWRITFSDVTFVLRDLKGLRYLHILLSRPGREVFVTELVAAVDAPSDGRAPSRAIRGVASGELRATRGEEGIPVLDDQAKMAYRNRVEQLREQIREGEQFGDLERVARARRELNAVTEQLSKAVGLGGRDRRKSSKVERSRVNVTRAIRTAIDKIRSFSPELAGHFDGAVSTGRYCLYDPDEELNWQL